LVSPAAGDDLLKCRAIAQYPGMDEIEKKKAIAALRSIYSKRWIDTDTSQRGKALLMAAESSLSPQTRFE
jgi:hypothetical protein